MSQVNLRRLAPPTGGLGWDASIVRQCRVGPVIFAMCLNIDENTKIDEIFPCKFRQIANAASKLGRLQMTISG